MAAAPAVRLVDVPELLFGASPPPERTVRRADFSAFEGLQPLKPMRVTRAQPTLSLHAILACPGRAACTLGAATLVWWCAARAAEWHAPAACGPGVWRFLRRVQLQQHAGAICGRGYTLLEDLLHITNDECASLVVR